MDTIHIPTTAEREWIVSIGSARRQQAKALGCQDRYDLKPKSEDDAIRMDIVGAAGEWALARELGEEWQATMQSFREPDHISATGTRWQAKCACQPHHGLIIHEGYDARDLYALALLIDGDLDKGLVIRGWRPAPSIERLGEWRETEDGRRPFRAIPTSKLKWMEDAQEWIARRRERI